MKTPETEGDTRLSGQSLGHTAPALDWKKSFLVGWVAGSPPGPVPFTLHLPRDRYGTFQDSRI